MKIFYLPALAAALFVLGCDNPVDDKQTPTAAPVNYSGTWQGTIGGTIQRTFADLKLVHKGSNLSGTVSVAINPLDPSQPSLPAKVSGSVGSDGGFTGEIFLEEPTKRTAFSVKGRFTSPTVAEGEAVNKLVTPNTTGKLFMRRTGP